MLKNFKIVLLSCLLIAMAFLLSGCADITLEKWIKEDKDLDEVGGEIVTDHEEFYEMIKETWDESEIEYNSREEEGKYILEIPRTRAETIVIDEDDSESDLFLYEKEKTADGLNVYNFGSAINNTVQDSNSNEDSLGQELEEELLSDYIFQWIVHFPNEVLDVQLIGSNYKVKVEDYSGNSVNLKMPLKEMPEGIIVRTR